MSIEALIKAHTEALLENTAAVKNLILSLAGRSVSAANKAANAVEKPEKVEKFDKSGPTGKTADKLIVDEIAASEAGQTEVNVEEGIDATVETPYETVRALLLKLAPTNRDGVKAVLTSAGIANLKVLLDKEDDFTTVNDQAKLEAVYADLQALEA